MNEKKINMDINLIVLMLIIGMCAGMLSGMVGVGGGIIIVPALIFFLGFSQKLAQGTSLGILLLPVGILGAIQYYKQGYMDIRLVLIISFAFFFGSYFGSKLALSLPQYTVKKIFATVMMLVAIKMLFFDKPKKDSTSIPSETGLYDQISEQISPKTNIPNS